MNEDVASVLLRGIVAVTMAAHGWNHVWGGGRLPGTARWFASLGFRHSRVHALLASFGELLAATMLVLGLLTPVAAGMVLATMLVAFVANHRPNGYFIFRPGEGYEYVLMIAVVAAAIGTLGPGAVSLDEALGWEVEGWAGLGITLAVGLGGAATVLGASWRPERQPA